jgi:hypothetical protein
LTVIPCGASSSAMFFVNPRAVLPAAVVLDAVIKASTIQA